MNIFVRKAREEDIPAILEITLEAFSKYAQDLGQPHKVAALNETLETIEKDMKKKHILVAFMDGKPVGSIRYEILPGNVSYISRFGVKPDAQNCGIGRALMLEVEKECRNAGVSSIVLHTASKMTNLVRFYYGLGYYIHSTSTEKGYIRALMCKDLENVESLELDSVMML